MFNDTKYTKWYFNIITNSTATGCVERHHIIPKSMGGDNSVTNIANLSPREHFICHMLLTKMTEGKHRSKMIFALQQFLRENPKHNRKVVNARTYDVIKRQVRQEISLLHKGKKVPVETVEKQKETRRRNNKKHTQEMREAVRRRTKHRWDTNREQMLASLRSDTTREKMSISAKARGTTPGAAKTLAKLHQLQVGSKNPAARTIQITSPEGDVWTVTGGFQQFCKLHSLPFSSMCWLLKGRIFTSGACVGWLAVYLD